MLLANIINIQADTLKPAAKTGENQTEAKAAPTDGSPTPAKNQLAQEIVELPAQTGKKVDTNVVALNSTKSAAGEASDPTTDGKTVTTTSVIENIAAASEQTTKPVEQAAANVQKLAENEKP